MFAPIYPPSNNAQASLETLPDTVLTRIGAMLSIEDADTGNMLPTEDSDALAIAFTRFRNLYNRPNLEHNHVNAVVARENAQISQRLEEHTKKYYAIQFIIAAVGIICMLAGGEDRSLVFAAGILALLGMGATALGSNTATAPLQNQINQNHDRARRIPFTPVLTVVELPRDGTVNLRRLRENRDNSYGTNLP